MAAKQISDVLAGVLILAGGQSSRMGEPKALLKVNNHQTLLEFHCACAKKLNVPIFIADNQKGFANSLPDAFKVCDYLQADKQGKGLGALSAIAGLLTKLDVIHKNQYILVISCDSLINIDKIADILINNMDKNYQVIYCYDKKDYPLLGMYACHLKDKIINELENNQLSVMKFLSHIDCKKVLLPNNFSGLTNFNTKDEYQNALTYFLSKTDINATKENYA